MPERSGRPEPLLNLHLGAGFFELLLHLLGFVFGDAFFDGLGRAFNERLGFGEAEARELADRLDDLDLLRRRFRRESRRTRSFRLLVPRCAPGAAAIIATGAAAETPYFSSSCLTRSASSRTVSLSICSMSSGTAMMRRYPFKRLRLRRLFARECDLARARGRSDFQRAP